MKNLLLMRHAKSDWSEMNQKDIERPLNKRGKKAAPKMGKMLLDLASVPDLILSSPATRAKCTAKRLIEACNYIGELKIIDRFYFGHLKDILNAIKSVDNSFKRIMIVGHNPAWEDLLSEFLTEPVYINMTTASIASIIFKIDDWNQINFGMGELKWFKTPKNQ